MAYHKREIPRGELGEASKITEEYHEFMDAHEQESPVLELCELADMVGAIEMYIKNKYNIQFSDLYKMTKATQLAFIDGSRK